MAGPTWVFGVNAVSFVAVLGTLALLPASRPAPECRSHGRRRDVGGVPLCLRPAQPRRDDGADAGRRLVRHAAGRVHDPGDRPLQPRTRAPGRSERSRRRSVSARCSARSRCCACPAGRTRASRYSLGSSSQAWPRPASACRQAHGFRSHWRSSAGFAGVLFVGLSTVVVQAMSTDEMRARAIAIWAAAFVGMVPFGALLTGGLAAADRPGGRGARRWRGSGRRRDRRRRAASAGRVAAGARRFPSPASRG